MTDIFNHTQPGHYGPVLESHYLTSSKNEISQNVSTHLLT